MLFDLSVLRGPDSLGEQDRDLFADKKRAAWKSISKAEARCDFAPDKWKLNSRGILFLSLWKASVYGMTLSDIMSDHSMPDFFAKNIYDFIAGFFNISTCSASPFSISEKRFENWCLITPPPRRHLSENFAVKTAKKISQMSGLTLFENVAKAKNKHRVNAAFELLNVPPYQNIICFDDIVTTGSTFQAMERILKPFNKNIIFISAINNKL